MVLQLKSNSENENIKKWILIKKDTGTKFRGAYRESYKSVWASDSKQKPKNIYCKKEKFRFHH